MSRPSHDAYFLAMLSLVASRSTCQRRAVGAIIIDAQRHILATGYNGTPRGFLHCGEERDKITQNALIILSSLTGPPNDLKCEGASDTSGDTRRCLAVHAEANALLQCVDVSRAHTLYCSATPCWECAKLICNTSIRRVVATQQYPTGLEILRAAGVSVEIIPIPV